MLRAYKVASVGIILLLAVLSAGCRDATIVAPGPSHNGGTSILRGQVDPTVLSFELYSETAGDPADPIQGPFVLRGTNLQYDITAGEITADLSVVNLSQEVLPEPVSVTFVSLLPEGVTLLNSDNGEQGPGAMIAFTFANDDRLWTPDEESLARAVRFGASTATSVGFSARIDVGQSLTGGAIGGIVWNDTNRDGVLDMDENGMGGVRLVLAEEQAPATSATRETITAADGTYRFDDLPSGFYRVTKSAMPGFEATTETVFHVLLIEDETGVHDFLMANFGCVQVSEPALGIDIGDYVEVKGEYLGDPPRIVAAEIEVERCSVEDDDQDPVTADDDCKDYGELRGVVTDVDPARRALQINGTWLRFPEGYEGNPLQKGTARHTPALADDDDDHPLNPENVQIGQRVRARAREVEGELLGFRLRTWSGSGERLRGLVSDVQRDEAGQVIGLRILQTDVVIEPGTRIE